MAAGRFENRIVELEDAIVRCSSARRATVLRQVLALFVSERPQATYDLNALDEVLVSLSRPAESSELVELTDWAAAGSVDGTLS